MVQKTGQTLSGQLSLGQLHFLKMGLQIYDVLSKILSVIAVFINVGQILQQGVLKKSIIGLFLKYSSHGLL